ncbi:MAG: four helix bundle protein [Salibacteraceae bacterium]
MKSFEDLLVYQKARDFRKSISDMAKDLPSEEKFRLKDQILRSSRSITAQIAEGHGRFHHQENIQFCRIARGSLDETHEHLNLALDEGFITAERHSTLLEMKFEVGRVLNGYINFLIKSKAPK